MIAAKGNYDANFIARIRRKIEEHGEDEIAEWVPWKEAETKFGHEVLLEMVSNKTVDTRLSEFLTPDTKIPWPENQQVNVVRATRLKRRRTQDTDMMKEGRDFTAENREAFAKEFAKARRYVH